MGLGHVLENKDIDIDANSQRYYPDHDDQDRLEEIIEKSKYKFPEGVEVTFIEVSDQMSKMWGRAYYRESGDYIRLSDSLVNNESWDTIETVILHEMVHLWMNQNNYDYSDADRVFNWVCGYIGADLHARENEEYDILEEFINHEI